jgi:hypothetical protein
LQQRCQGSEHRNVNIGSGANTPGRAGRPIEHPGRNLQPSPGCLTREAATENLSASLLNHLMNMDQASGPRMPRIKKLVLRDPVGVPSSCCTMTSGRTGHWTKMHHSLVKFGESEASNHTPSLADFTTTTPELKFSVHTGVELRRKNVGKCVYLHPPQREALSSSVYRCSLARGAAGARQHRKPLPSGIFVAGLAQMCIALEARPRAMSRHGGNLRNIPADFE